MRVKSANQSGTDFVRKHGRMTLAVGIVAGAFSTFGAHSLSWQAGHPERTPIVATDIVMTAFSSDAMSDTIQKACNTVGCDIDDLHPTILAYADTMTRDQLEAGRWAQMRLIVQHLEAIGKTPEGSDSSKSAHLELTAAARIAHLYTAKLHYHR